MGRVVLAGGVTLMDPGEIGPMICRVEAVTTHHAGHGGHGGHGGPESSPTLFDHAGMLDRSWSALSTLFASLGGFSLCLDGVACGAESLAVAVVVCAAIADCDDVVGFGGWCRALPVV